MSEWLRRRDVPPHHHTLYVKLTLHVPDRGKNPQGGQVVGRGCEREGNPLD